jgi:hypothetical protein
MFKKPVILTHPAPARQDAPFRGRGRSDRRAEACRGPVALNDATGETYVEALREARTKLGGFFNILLGDWRGEMLF